jgi:predicted nucleotidyltransferase
MFFVHYYPERNTLHIVSRTNSKIFTASSSVQEVIHLWVSYLTFQLSIFLNKYVPYLTFQLEVFKFMCF